MPGPLTHWQLKLVIGVVLIGSSIAWTTLSGTSLRGAMGGPGVIQRNPELAKMEYQAQRLRQQRESLSRRETALREHLKRLELRRYIASDPEAHQKEVERSTASLRKLLLEQKNMETHLLASLRQMWEARAKAIALGSTQKSIGPITLSWPVRPAYGISAGFQDDRYRKRFGFDHSAIDIPTEQRSVVTAAADGLVVDVTDNDYGFNSITIQHDGYLTLYGHTESFLVSEGMEVKVGEPIARSGGMPGTIGAGHLSTGPHVHFELIVGGKHIDPLTYLPQEELQVAIK